MRMMVAFAVLALAWRAGLDARELLLQTARR
jgi:hypothetical protein